jgi:phage portal protein BeeE
MTADQRRALYQQLLNAGAITPNQTRRLENLPPILRRPKTSRLGDILALLLIARALFR